VMGGGGRGEDLLGWMRVEKSVLFSSFSDPILVPRVTLQRGVYYIAISL
jgi:hypothetical protein